MGKNIRSKLLCKVSVRHSFTERTFKRTYILFRNPVHTWSSCCIRTGSAGER